MGVSGNNIVGIYDTGHVTGNFLYNGSSYTSLNAFGAGSGNTISTAVSGNNVVGYYYDNGVLGFLYNGSGYTSLAAFRVQLHGTRGRSGNNVVGNYSQLAVGITASCTMVQATPNSIPSGLLPPMPLVSQATTSSAIINLIKATTPFMKAFFTTFQHLPTPPLLPSAPQTFRECLVSQGTTSSGTYFPGRLVPQGFLYNSSTKTYTQISVLGSQQTLPTAIDGNAVSQDITRTTTAPSMDSYTHPMRLPPPSLPLCTMLGIGIASIAGYSWRRRKVQQA